MKAIYTVCLCLCVSLSTLAQTSGNSFKKQQKEPQRMDNYLFAIYYTNGGSVYNTRSTAISTTDPVQLFCINPSGANYAVVEKGEQSGSVRIFDLWEADRQLTRIRYKGARPTALCFSADARRLMVALNNNSVVAYNAQKFLPTDTIQASGPVTKMAMSANNYFLTLAHLNQLYVYNVERKEVRLHTTVAGGINDVKFSPDSKKMAVLTANGVLSIYDTSDFGQPQTVTALGLAKACDFNSDGKYLAVATSDSRIAVINLMDPEERHYIDSRAEGITDLRFVLNSASETFLIYNNREGISYTQMSDLSPNFTRLLADELNDRMAEWLRRGDDETLDAYNLRVNDDTRAEKFQLLEQEIVTRMADDIMDHTELALGGYNETTSQLAIKFNTLPEIYIEVPSNEVGAFKDPQQLEMRNNIFGLNTSDHFELIYSDIYNRVNQKTYVFDNLNRSSLSFLSNSDDFVPLSVIQETNEEQIRLDEIKEEIVVAAKAQQIISDHTHVDVKTDVVTAVDASGKKIMNYIIDFKYDVEAEYSFREDFKPGHYKPQESGAATTMLRVMKQALTTEFAKYVVPGKVLHMDITGMADASPVSGSIAYDGAWGDYENEPIDKNGELTAITVTRKKGITSNEALAFIRALGMKEYIFGNVPELQKMKSDCTYHVQVSDKTGGEYRRIIVRYTFEDAK